MKTFYITSTIEVEAKSREELVKTLESERHNEGDQSAIAYDLLSNAEVDEVEIAKCKQAGCNNIPEADTNGYCHSCDITSKL